MSHETAWRRIADRQHQESMMRMQEQQLRQQQLKKAYMNQLNKQLKQNQQLRRKQRSLSSWQDRKIIEDSIEKQKKTIEREARMSKLLAHQQEISQYESYRNGSAVKDNRLRMKNKEQEIQRKQHEASQLASMFQQQDQIRKKQQLAQIYLKTIEQQKEQRKKAQLYQKMREKKLLQQSQHKKTEQQIQRLKFYHALRERAKRVDYGSHRTIEQANEETEFSKRRMMQQREQERLEESWRLEQVEREKQAAKRRMGEQYKNELKHQLEIDRQMKQYKAMQEVGTQRSFMKSVEDMSKQLEEQNKQKERLERQEYGRLLQDQMRSNQAKRYNEPEMSAQELKFNLQLLQNELKNNGSLDTYELDYMRKKQLSVLGKSVSKGQGDRLNYFAEKGNSIIN